MIVRLTILLGLAIVATPAAAQESRWRQAASCIAASDRAICWLGQLLDSPQVNMDRELAGAPAVLEALGVKLVEAHSQPTLPDTDLPAEFRPYVEALSQAALAIRTGAPAADVISILSPLPVSDPPVLPNPLGQSLSFGRLDAYAMLSVDEIAGARPAVQDALLAAWEEDIPSELETVIYGGPVDLAGALMQRGDKTSAERVLRRLAPDDAPAAVREMIRHGLLDAAYDLARSATVRDRTAGLIKANAAMERRSAAYFERIKPEMDAAMDAALAEFSEEERALLLAHDFEEPEQEPAEDPATVAASEVAHARIDVMDAADRAGRSDISRTVAVDLFEAGLVNDDEDARRGLIASLAVLVNAELPDASTRMALAEARLETVADGRNGMPLRAVYQGWIRLDLPERAEAVLQRWRPLAEREARAVTEGRQSGLETPSPHLAYDLVSILIDRDQVAEAEALGLMPPTQPIEHDMNRGLGISRLEERLAGRSLNDQGQILSTCSWRSRERRAWADAEACASRLAAIADTPQLRLTAAELLLPLAEQAVRAGDMARAQGLLIRALEIGAPAAEIEDIRATFSFQLDSAIVSVSKGLLRQDGRLEPPAPSATRDRP